MAAAVKNKPRNAQVVNDSLESTRRILSMVEESEEAGNRTLVALGDQGEQLDRIEEGMDRIHADMRKAEKNISGMEKYCGICVLPWKKVNLKDDSVWKANDDGKVVASQPQRVIDERKRNEMGQPAQSGYVARITNDAREDEIDANLGQVNSILGNLRNMAIDMGSELDNQNKQIERINAKADSNNSRVDGANKRVNNLLKS
ncbi:synaptosomal-associated protein 25-like [Drosophila nasuta]|uniref:synaptosomal-associated protein 25-like n=1 Tax=Drosophila nasuta TaxID=42062 RepID=UPI00295E2ED3|nr:synaptosomal-associated protein 25-like [Drosophila nasuta]